MRKVYTGVLIIVLMFCTACSEDSREEASGTNTLADKISEDISDNSAKSLTEDKSTDQTVNSDEDVGEAGSVTPSETPVLDGENADKSGSEAEGGYSKDHLPDNDAVVEVKEEYFLTQINDLYVNYEDYVGATIIVEGMYWYYEDDNGVYEAVYRKGPGCCGNDGWGGFFMNLSPEKRPNENAWIRVKGRLFLDENPETYGLFLVDPELEVLEQRGAEVVTR